MTAVTVEMIQKLKFELLPHPPSIPDLASIWLPSFQTSQRCFTWMLICKWQKEVKGMVHTWPHTQLGTFFTDDIRKLVA